MGPVGPLVVGPVLWGPGGAKTQWGGRWDIGEGKKATDRRFSWDPHPGNCGAHLRT